MKKTALFLAAVLLLAVLAPHAMLADDGLCRVEYRSMSNYIRFNRNSAFEEFDVAVGDKLPQPHAVPMLYGGSELIYRLQSTGEEIDITDYTVTEAMVIEVDFRESPEPVHCVTFYSPMCDIGPYNSRDTVKIHCADGYVLTEDDLPTPVPVPGDLFTTYLKWTPDPVDHVVYEDVTFTASIADRGVYDVMFMGQYIYEHIKTYHDVPKGSSVEPPEPLEKEGYVFLGWSNERYLNVQENTVVFSRYALLGDANLNDELDVGDATLVLRAVVHLDEPGPNYDYNQNGRVDSGDASGILLACVNK